MKTDAVIFDFDDTLVVTNAVFDAARIELFDAMRALGLSEEEAWPQWLNEADIAQIGRIGHLAKECFPLACADTYRYFAARSGLSIEEAVAYEMERIGWRVFEEPIERMPEAEPVLRALQGKVRLFLLTQGDRAVQEDRLCRSGLLPYFDACHVVREKTPAAFEMVIQEHEIDRSQSLMVGNSIRSDINPAISVGLPAVLCAFSDWSYEFVEPVGAFHTIHALSEIMELIEK